MDEIVYVRNTALSDRITIRGKCEDPQGRGEEQETQIPIPEELVNKISQYVGDGKGRLSVGGSLSSSVNFGFKAEAMVNATVACDSDPDIMMLVNEVIYPVIEELIVVNHARMSALRDQMVPDTESDKRLNLVVEPDEPPAKPATRPQASKTEAMQLRPSVPSKAKAPAKPSFRR